MLKEEKIKEIEENIFCIKVNSDGILNSGIEKEIASIYPKVALHLRQICKSFEFDYEKLKGKYQFINIGSNKYICCCFTQKPNYEIDISAIKMCFKDIIDIANKRNLSIAIPDHFCSVNDDELWKKVKETLGLLTLKMNKTINIIKFNDDEGNKENFEEKLNCEVKKMEENKKYNSLDKLNDILFNQIQKLSKACDDSDVQQEISKSYAISHMSQRIINSANVYLKTIELSYKKGLKNSDMPEVLKIDNE